MTENPLQSASVLSVLLLGPGVGRQPGCDRPVLRWCRLLRWCRRHSLTTLTPRRPWEVRDTVGAERAEVLRSLGSYSRMLGCGSPARVGAQRQGPSSFTQKQLSVLLESRQCCQDTWPGPQSGCPYLLIWGESSPRLTGGAVKVRFSSKASL